MTIFRRTAILGVLLLSVAACADLEVTNQNDADADRALVTPGDIQSLISGSYRQYWNGTQQLGFGPALSNMAWQHSGWPANFGVVFYSGMPRPATINDPGDQFYGNMSFTWNQSFKALAAINQGLRAIEADPEIAEALGAGAIARLNAYAKYVQGLAHGAIALHYDQGFIIDEDTEIFDAAGQVIPQPIVDRNAVIAASMQYFDEAVALATGATNWPDGNTIPSSWMSVAVTPSTLVQLAHSNRARHRAAFARTPAERAAVDWTEVVSDVDAGVTADWHMAAPRTGGTWTITFFNQYHGAAWQQLSYQVAGMADQSGKYQQWLATPPSSRLPDIGGEPFLIITPDLRFPQGATLAEQAANRGTLYDIPVTSSGNPTLGNHFQQPGRGTYRWSYYWARTMRDWGLSDGMFPVIKRSEMDLLKAEALYRLAGNTMTAEAAALVNNTRVAAGLDDISDGVNDSCVPRLPDESCGDFFEALKWEKRMVTIFSPGLYLAPWYFEGRGWGDLYANTPLELPAPCLEMQMQFQPCSNYGGIGGQNGSPGSIYAWPHEQ